MARRSFECGGESVGGLTYIPDGSEPVANRSALPVAIGIQLLLLGIGYPADCLVDAHGSHPLYSVAQ